MNRQKEELKKYATYIEDGEHTCFWRCKSCNEAKYTINKMIKHLDEEHNINITEKDFVIIPCITCNHWKQDKCRILKSLSKNGKCGFHSKNKNFKWF